MILTEREAQYNQKKKNKQTKKKISVRSWLVGADLFSSILVYRCRLDKNSICVYVRYFPYNDTVKHCYK